MTSDQQIWERFAVLEQQMATLEVNLRRMLRHAQLDWVEAAPASGQHPEVKAMVQAGNKIGAIKLLRDQTGMGLREAQQAVDQLEAEV